MAKKGYIQLTNGKKIEFELYPDAAPGTVANFEKLANEGFYDGLKFHRVIPGFVSQEVARTAPEQADLDIRLNARQKGIRTNTKPVLSQWLTQEKIPEALNSLSSMSLSRT